MPKYKDMVGLKCGRLSVLERASNDAQGNAQWLCQCDCGGQSIVRGRSLRSGHTSSCGCLLSEKSRDRLTALLTTHGHSKSPLYRVYHAMLGRCSNPKDRGFPNYGGRGIGVCKSWADNFPAFYAWALSAGYRKGLEIDRIDNDGPYSPENCRWVTPIENCQNTRKARSVTLHNRTTQTTEVFTSINHASRKTGLSASTIARMMRGIRTTNEEYVVV